MLIGQESKQLPRFWLFAAAFTFLVCLVLFVYSFSLNGPFIWDDQPLVRDNLDIRSFNNIGVVLLHPWGWGAGEASSFYRPLVTISYMFDYSLYGLNPGGYHVTNILLHLAAILALFWVLRNFVGSSTAYYAALLWGISPVNVAAVAYIANRAEVMAGLFIFLSLGAYLRFHLSGRYVWLILFFLFFISALLVKETALLVLVIIALYHFLLKSRPRRTIVLSIGVLTLSYFFWRRYIFSGTVFPFSIFPTTYLWRRFVLMGCAFFDYCRMLIWPFGLHAEYMDWPMSVWNVRIFFGWGLLAGSLFGIWRFRERRPLVAFCLAWYVFTLVPFCGIYPLAFYKADHYLYLSAASFFTIIVCFLSEKRFFLFIMAVLLIFYSTLTIRQNSYWSNAVRFYETTLHYSPDSERVAVLLAWEYLHSGDRGKAVAVLDAFVKGHPAAKIAQNELTRI